MHGCTYIGASWKRRELLPRQALSCRTWSITCLEYCSSADQTTEPVCAAQLTLLQTCG